MTLFAKCRASSIIIHILQIRILKFKGIEFKVKTSNRVSASDFEPGLFQLILSPRLPRGFLPTRQSCRTQFSRSCSHTFPQSRLSLLPLYPFCRWNWSFEQLSDSRVFSVICQEFTEPLSTPVFSWGCKIQTQVHSPNAMMIVRGISEMHGGVSDTNTPRCSVSLLTYFLFASRTSVHWWCLWLQRLPRDQQRITALTLTPKVCHEISRFYDYFRIALVYR